MALKPEFEQGVGEDRWTVTRDHVGAIGEGLQCVAYAGLLDTDLCLSGRGVRATGRAGERERYPALVRWPSPPCRRQVSRGLRERIVACLGPLRLIGCMAAGCAFPEEMGKQHASLGMPTRELQQSS